MLLCTPTRHMSSRLFEKTTLLSSINIITPGIDYDKNR
jgi:hypothetical protein